MLKISPFHIAFCLHMLFSNRGRGGVQDNVWPYHTWDLIIHALMGCIRSQYYVIFFLQLHHKKRHFFICRSLLHFSSLLSERGNSRVMSSFWQRKGHNRISRLIKAIYNWKRSYFSCSLLTQPSLVMNSISGRSCKI